MNLKDAIREAVDERDKQTEQATVTPTKLQTAKAAKQQTVKTANNKSSKPAKIDNAIEETAAMTVRVSRRHRLHWLIAAKKEGTSLTAAITQAMNARFGEPDD